MVTLRRNANSPLRQLAPVPAARPITDFCATESAEDHHVFMDRQRLEFHRLNDSAYAVWRLCDGKRTEADIAGELDAPVETVQLTVEELGEAGLLQAAYGDFNSKLHRREVLRLAAAGLVGVLGLPVISSITAADADAAPACCGEDGTGSGACLNNNRTCTASCQCKSECCCQGPGRHADCTRRGSCSGANEYCIGD
jgi:hypothetical protein